MHAYEIRAGFGLDNLTLAERPDPLPGHGQVLVRVRSASLNYRDLLMVKGLYNPKIRLPLVPCSDGAGDVIAVGEGVTRVRVGDRVAGIFMQKWLAGELDERGARSALGGDRDGMLVELVVLSEEGVVPLPEHLSYEEGATLPCAAVTAWHAVVESGIRPGDTVLILGTGGVSIFALQFALMCGARVIGTSGSDAKLSRMKEMGAADGLNYGTVPDWDRAVRELTFGAGVDLVVEVGGAGTLLRSLRAVRVGGRISLIGVLSGSTGEINPLPVVMKKVCVQGIYVGSRAMFEAMNRAIALHRLRPVIDRVFPFVEAPAALSYLESGSHFGKVCISM
jgi:NADPH:quinone reductase-like Zn-dependent oxidoreductase